MNFLCDNCKQKYHVDDEKLRGRAITRFKCKKCSHVIEIHGSSVPAAGTTQDSVSGVSASPLLSEPPPASVRPAPRPRPTTITGAAVPRPGSPGAPGSLGGPSGLGGGGTVSGVGAPLAAAAASAGVARVPRTRSATSTGPAFGAGAPVPSSGRPATLAGGRSPLAARAAGPTASAILNASETGWYAGIRDLPVGPLTRKELSARVQSGDVSPETLVWREGLDDWRPLRNVAELGDLLRLVAQKMSGNLLDEMGKRPSDRPAPGASPSGAPAARAGAKVVPLASARPHDHPLSSARPMMTDDEEEATRVSSVDPGIAAALLKSFSPLKPSAPPAREAAHEAAHAAEGEEESDRTMIEAPPRSTPLSARPLARPAASPSRPPPAPQRPERTSGSGATPAPAPTPAPSPASVPAPALASALDGPTAETAHPAPQGPAARSVPPPADPPAPAVSLAPAPGPGPTPSAHPSARPPAHDDDLPEDLFARPSTPRPPAAPPVAQPLTPSLFPPGNSGPPPSAAAPHSPYLAPLHGIDHGGAIPTARQAERRGLSAGIALLFGGGMMVAGIAAGIVISQRTPGPTVQAPAPPPPPPPAPVPPPAEPVPSETAAPEVPPENPAQAETPAAQPAGGPEHPSRPGTARPHRPSEHPSQTAALTPEQQRMLRELERQGSSGGPAGGPVGAAPLRTQPAQTASAPQDDGARAGAAARAFGNSRIANNCWQSLLRLNPSVQPRSVQVTLSINGQGRFTRASVSNSPDPRFDQCVSSRIATIQPLGAGTAMDAVATVNLSVGN